MSNRPERFLPMMVREGEGVAVYAWPNTPVQLWKWSIGPETPTRIDLRGLEHFPGKSQLDPALAMLAEWREQYRRESGELAGPGRGEEWVKIYHEWETSGFDSDVYKKLKIDYAGNEDYHGVASNTFDRTMRRYKRRRTKTE